MVILKWVMDMLGNLRKGEKGKIIDLSQVNRLVKRRLLDLGITEGSEVSVKNTMPFGGPLMLESSGQCIGIRKREALRIEVERI
jgi:ferrous iron transport protein A